MTTRTPSRWALGATVFLVAFGGFTRGSGSGYGCQDRWPLCEDGLLGGLLPRADFHMIIEWTHRWLAAIVGVLAVATAVIAWRTSRRWIAWVATGAIGVIGVQAWVGRLIVVRDLDADLVSLHLTISMTVAALFTVVVAATSRATDEPADRGWVVRFGIGAALSFLVLLLGSLVHNIYVPGWPLTLDQLIPDLGARTIAIHFFHRVGAAVAFAYLIWLVRRVYTAPRPRPERLLAVTALAAFVVNIALGAAHVFTRVDSSALVATHLGVATIAWVALVGATTLSTGAGSRPATA